MFDPVPIVAEKRREIAALCRGYRVRRLDLFGSAARGVDFTDASDVDLLVGYEPGETPSWGPVFDLRDALEELLGRKIALVSNAAIRDPSMRASVDRSREALHGP